MKTEGRPDNRRLAQWRVKWLNEHSTSHQLLWCIDSFVLRNPPLLQAPKRWYPQASTYCLVISRSEIFAYEKDRVKDKDWESFVVIKASS